MLSVERCHRHSIWHFRWKVMLPHHSQGRCHSSQPASVHWVCSAGEEKDRPVKAVLQGSSGIQNKLRADKKGAAGVHGSFTYLATTRVFLLSDFAFVRSSRKRARAATQSAFANL